MKKNKNLNNNFLCRCGAAAVTMAVLANVAAPALTFAMELESDTAFSSEIEALIDTLEATPASTETAAVDEIAPKLFELMTTVRNDADYKRIYKILDTLEHRDKLDENDDIEKELKSFIKEFIPDAPIDDMEPEELILYVITLPKLMEWVRVFYVMHTIESDAEGATSVEQLKELEAEQLGNLYTELTTAIKNLRNELPEVDLFELVLRINLWPTFREFHERHALVASASYLDKYSKNAQLVFSTTKMYNSKRTIWDALSVGWRERVKKLTAMDAIDLLMDRDGPLNDETLERTIYDIRYDLRRAENVLKSELREAFPKLENIDEMTISEMVKTAKTIDKYDAYARLAMALEPFMCADEEDYSPQDNKVSAGYVTPKTCCLPYQGVDNTGIEQYANGNITPENPYDPDFSQDNWEILGRILMHFQGEQDKFVACMKDNFTDDEIWDIYDEVKDAAEEIDKNVILGLIGRRREGDVPEAPSTGSLFAKGDGELTDLAVGVLVASVAVTSVLGIAVIGKLYLKHKF